MHILKRRTRRRVAMTGMSVSAIDDRYVLQRMSLGYIEPFFLKPISSIPLWKEFSLKEAPKGRMRLTKRKQLSLEEKLENIFSRLERLFESEMYAKASFLLEEVLDLTKENPIHTAYRAAAYFHLGSLYAHPGENEEKASQHLLEAITLNGSIVQENPSEKTVGRFLRSHLELGRVYSQFGKKEQALEKVHQVLSLTTQYVDILSLEQYTSFTKAAQDLGTKLI